MKTINGFFVLILLLLVSSKSFSANLTITIVFPYFQPSSVEIFGDFSEWAHINLQSLSSNTFQYTSESIAIGVDHVFNASFVLPPYYNSNPIYISTNYRNLSRIIYAKVYINNQLITSTYVGPDSNIHFNLTTDGKVYPGITNGMQNIDDRIPPEVHWPYKDIHIPNAPNPNLSLTQIAGWVQVLHDNNYDGLSQIEIDYIRLHARIGDTDTLISFDEYNTPSATFSDGGLYLRYPFFPGDDTHDPMPASITNGNLIFNPSSVRNKVWHFWNATRAPTNPLYTSYWFEVKFRITDKACVQIGVDFRDAFDSTKEACVSDWQFESYDNLWHVIMVDTKSDSVSYLETVQNVKPKDFSLSQNYPNPFNPLTTIMYSVPKTSLITIEILDILGKTISTLVNEMKAPGNYFLKFDASNYSSGVYFYRMKAKNFEKTKKLTLVK